MFRPHLIACLAGLVLSAPLPAQEGDNDASIEKLRLAKFVMPDFPEIVRAAGYLRCAVTVAIGRDAEGLVNDVLVLDSSHALLTQSVVGAVRQWKFARPSNVQPPGRPIVPVVRFFFGAKGVVMVPAMGGLASRDKEKTRFDNTPVMLPSFADLDEVPKPIHYPLPTYTGTKAERFAGGTATVKYFVDETGKVRVPIVLECSSPELGLAALAAVEQWTYEPPRMAGHPTIAVETGIIRFAKPKS